VTADGRILKCDRDRHGDLFWASRGGGGGNFGIVTRFRFRTHRVSRASYFIIIWPWSAREAVVRRFQNWAPHAPDGVGAICRLATGLHSPTLEVFGQYLGPERTLRMLLESLMRGLPRANVEIGTESWLDLQHRWAGCLGKGLASCREFRPVGFSAASDYVDRPLSSEAIATMGRWIERRQGAGGALLFDAYGGAINRVRVSATAFAHRNMLGSFQYFSSWRTPDAEGSTRAWIRGFRRAMRPFVSGSAYQNYIDSELRDWQHAYYGPNLDRLIRIKGRYDPHNLFRFAQSIPTK
jgi:FAD/FMN-containing dehydrogenase